MAQSKPKEGRALTKERRDVYNRHRRERYRIRKNERRQERETNSYSERRLHFIRVIMAQKHISQAQLAQRMGTTRQAIHEVFTVNDDAKLSKVIQMLTACGCSCSIQLSTKETDVVKKKPLYSLKVISLGKSPFGCPPQRVSFRIRIAFKTVRQQRL